MHNIYTNLVKAETESHFKNDSSKIISWQLRSVIDETS